MNPNLFILKLIAIIVPVAAALLHVAMIFRWMPSIL